MYTLTRSHHTLTTFEKRAKVLDIFGNDFQIKLIKSFRPHTTGSRKGWRSPPICGVSNISKGCQVWRTRAQDWTKTQSAPPSSRPYPGCCIHLPSKAGAWWLKIGFKNPKESYWNHWGWQKMWLPSLKAHPGLDTLKKNKIPRTKGDLNSGGLRGVDQRSDSNDIA